MKRAVSVGLACMLVMALLASCGGGGLSGTYKADDGTSVTFNGNKITMSVMGMSIEGTYSISGNTMTVKFDIMGESMEETMSYSKSGNTITIEGLEYKK